MLLYCLLVLPIIAADANSRLLSVSLKVHSNNNSLPETLPLSLKFPNSQGQLVRAYSTLSRGSHRARFIHSSNESHRSVQINFDTNNSLPENTIFNIRENGITHLKLKTEDYKMSIDVSQGDYQEEPGFNSSISDSPNSCTCVKRNCACCIKINLPEIKFQHGICANISYNPETVGIDLSVGIDGYYYTQEISARNPPPVCFAVPGLHDVAGLCIAFQKLDISKKRFSGCIEFEAEVIHMRVVHFKLGCFNMPI